MAVNAFQDTAVLKTFDDGKEMFYIVNMLFVDCLGLSFSTWLEHDQNF